MAYEESTKIGEIINLSRNPEIIKRIMDKKGGERISDADLNAIMKEFKGLNKKDAKEFLKSLERAKEAEEGEEKLMPKGKASGGRVGAADMSAKKTSTPKKKKMPQYYMGGGMIKKGKKYAYGGRVAKYKG